MLFSTMLVDAGHATFKDREKTFNRVRGHVLARIFLGGVIDALMRRETRARLAVVMRFIGMHPALARYIVSQDLADCLGIEFVHLD